MKAKLNRALLGLVLVGGLMATGAIHSTQPASAAEQSLAGQSHAAIQARKAVCKTYGQAEWFLLTGMDSEYGGTMCVR
jgi:hypothetical protein